MFRGIFQSKLPSCSAIFGIRSYVTRHQNTAITKALRAADVLVNPRIGVPEPMVSAEDRQRLRTDPLLAQLVNMIMRDGKKMQAEKHVQRALLDIRQITNDDPYKLLADAVDMVAPLMDTKSARQGSKIIQVPRALNLRQRRRRAIVWLLDAVSRRNERSFFMRLSGELQAIVNGTSGILEKKLRLHRMVLLNRSNIRTTKSF
ncbi:hypothetical protein GGI25_001067 [Coemansia spiralis]|uniref:Small ribosomal subunit protein uS7 domain-containing protein n=2 Tax=Coemansia TaxID=4863 RepID=A0A9W8GDC3_9FUNG|nr:hypothetical protein EDC05_000737 [Coemansia umbellata]KAJ2625168.1 hypothetical protein GGI26_000971 [Coemansia sp. RSA 1358]KAJ2679878.1 hypothetical protein GGI25_001067 [Coemansia spiralis]